MCHKSRNLGIPLLNGKCPDELYEARHKVLVLITALHDLIHDVLLYDLHLCFIRYVKCRVQLYLCEILLHYMETEAVYCAYLSMVYECHLLYQVFIIYSVCHIYIYLLLKCRTYLLLHLGCRRIGKCHNKQFIHVYPVLIRQFVPIRIHTQNHLYYALNQNSSFSRTCCRSNKKIASPRVNYMRLLFSPAYLIAPHLRRLHSLYLLHQVPQPCSLAAQPPRGLP